MICFYCGNQVNPANQRYVSASIQHFYKAGETRISQRNFHKSCYPKFVIKKRRPFNPHTTYLPLYAVLILKETKLKVLTDLQVPSDES